MTVATFDLESLIEQINDITLKMPRILRRSTITLDLADEVEHCMSAVETPFTMAVVGQMRVGKSTLINAIVGEELAITGVTETTATGNWLRHGNQEQARRFRVVWDDAMLGATEERDLSEREKWTGDSELATRTHYLEFVSTADFLKTVQIVDTPGTRSVLVGHEETVRGFLLAERRNERDTLHYGGAADCVVYVLPPVGRQNDEELLNDFVAKTRLANSSAYNSVAVLHKWETLEHAEPWSEAQNKAKRAFEKLQRHVADVIPVSGPLSLAVRHRPSSFWETIVRLVRATPSESLRKLMGLEKRFDTLKEAACPLTSTERKQLRIESGLVWPCFATVVKLACAGNIVTGDDLRTAVEQASGIDRLMRFLQQRFLDRARLIRASNLLRKALHPIDKAVTRLRDHSANLAEREALANHAVREIEMLREEAECTRNLVKQVIADLERDISVTGTVQREAENEACTIRSNFEDFDRDLICIRLLDQNPTWFSEHEAAELYAVLGAYGHSLEQRLSRCSIGNDSADGRSLAKQVESRLPLWLDRCERAAGERRRILEQVVSRLEAAVDVLDRVPVEG